jgi:hypothetical protein
MSALAPGDRWPTSARRSAFAPFKVAAVTASSMVMCIWSTAVVMQYAIEVVYELPGLQLLARATVAPASMS